MNKRPTALFVGINYRYLNLTNLYVPAIVSRVCTTSFYGPGFVSEAVLKAGIESFVDALGGIDLIFATKDMSAGLPAEGLDRFTRRYTAMLNGGAVTPGSHADVSRFLQRNRHRVIAFITDLDPHSAPQWTLDSIEQHAAYYVGWGSQFLDTLGDENALANERYIQRKVKAGYKLGLLDRFANRLRHRFVSIGFYVSEAEFFWGTIVNRRYDVAVPGELYARRARFVQLLKASRNLRVPHFSYRYGYKVADRLHLAPYSNFFALNLYSLAFQRILSQSRCCLTDGGANNYPVRKFFEVPAAGSVLLCHPAAGMEALGFVDGVHYIATSDAVQTLDVVRSIAHDPARYDGIAAAGRELVFRQHSLAARAEQLGAAVERILAGSFEGTQWVSGELVCTLAAAAAEPLTVPTAAR